MSARHPHRYLVIGAAGALLAAAAAIGFVVGRSAVSDDQAPPAAAEESPPANAGRSPAIPVVPTVGGVDPVTGLPMDPDRTKPLWFAPYHEAEAKLPLFEGKLAGVRITRGGNVAEWKVRNCPPGPYSENFVASVGTPVDVSPPSALGTLELHRAEVLFCADGTVVSASAHYSAPTDPGRGRYGGSLILSRYVPFDPGDPMASIDLRTPRVRETTIAGGPALLAEPPLPHIGVGTGAVVAYRDGVVTVISTSNLPLADLLAVAEEVLQR